MATSHESTISIETNPADDHLSENTLRTVEQFEIELNEKKTESCCPCFNQWWNSRFKHQRFIVHIVEKTAFHIGIIVLVLVDCLLVVGQLMLDFIYLSEKCGDQKRTTEHEDVKNPKLELAMEILHYASIFLLAIFVLEVLIKIYAFGKKWWNFREKKMEWLDAIIVIVSFIVDIYFLKRPNIIAEISLLFISFRLWRIVRIINSVAQSIRSKDEQARTHLTTTYIQIIEVLLNVSVKKTDAASELRQNITTENLDRMIEKFSSLDQSCRSILTDCLTPSPARQTLTNIVQNLQETLERIRLTSSTLSLTDQSKSQSE